MQWEKLQKHLSGFPHQERERIHDAFVMAEQAHHDQQRKSGEPYITHPVAVASLLIDLGADSETVIAALLHDVIEDTPVTAQQIESTFGHNVAELVEGVTKLNKEHVIASPTLDEKIETLRKMFTLMQKDIRVMVIKLIDRLHNMRTAQFLSEEKRKKLAEETRDVYVKIADRLSMNILENAIEEECLAILEPEYLEQLRERKALLEQRGSTVIPMMREQLIATLPTLKEVMHIHLEPNEWKELGAQIRAEGATTGISDITAAITCRSIDDCYRALGALHTIWQRETLSFQDYINAPLLNGYKGLHTTIILPTGERVRCKIRTEEMQRYAEHGILTKCFDNQAIGIAQYLPWTQRISPLAEDTKDRSNEFWESLQSDILGESIIIHGPDDGTAIIPRGSTALDGAFYLFGDLALRTKHIIVNGKEVSFDEKLEYADSMNITLAPQLLVDHAWLSSVQSGLATAKIRHTLRLQPRQHKVRVARMLLEEFMRRNHRGFLEEYNERKWDQLVTPLGYASLRDAYVAVADGELSVEALYTTLFRRQTLTSSGMRKHTVTFWLYGQRCAEMDQQILRVLHAHHLGSYSARPGQKGGQSIVIYRCSMHIDEEERTQLFHALRMAGALHIQIEANDERRMRILLCVLLMLLWGMDPVLASRFLDWGVTPALFTVLRKLSVFGTAAVVIGVSRRYLPLSPLPLRMPSLWIAGIATFAISLLTYFALQEGSPVLYNTVLRGNPLLVALVEIAQQGGNSHLIWASLMMIAGYALIVWTEGWTWGLLFSLCALAAFAVYTVASTRFQRKIRVLARYPQFFFASAAIALFCCVTLLPFIEPDKIPLSMALSVSIYSVGFIGIPYVMFYWLTKRYGYATISPWIGLSLVITFIGQAASTGTQDVVHMIPAALLLITGGWLAARAMPSPEQH